MSHQHAGTTVLYRHLIQKVNQIKSSVSERDTFKSLVYPFVKKFFLLVACGRVIKGLADDTVPD